jgi:hypothetical protein
MGIILLEAERFGQFAVLVDKLNAILFGEMARLHLVQKSDSFDRTVAERDQRFADVEAWEMISLEDRDSVASLGEYCGCGTSRRPTADDNHIWFFNGLDHD